MWGLGIDEKQTQPKLQAPAGAGYAPAPSLPPWLTNSPEEVSILGKSHEWLRQLPQPLLQDPSDSVDGEVFQLNCSRVCTTGTCEYCVRTDQWGCLRHLLPSAYLSAVPGVIPVSGWQRPTCGKGPRYTGHASLRVPEVSPTQWAQRPCHWSGCSHTLRSGLVRHPAHSTVWDGWRVRPGCHFLSVFHLSLPTLSLKGCLRGGNLLHEAPIGWMSLTGE